MGNNEETNIGKKGRKNGRKKGKTTKEEGRWERVGKGVERGEKCEKKILKKGKGEKKVKKM